MPSLFKQSKTSTLVPELYEESNKKYTKYWDTKYLILQSAVEALQRGLEPILTLHSTIENRETTSKRQKLFETKILTKHFSFLATFLLSVNTFPSQLLCEALRCDQSWHATHFWVFGAEMATILVFYFQATPTLLFETLSLIFCHNQQLGVLILSNLNIFLR